MALCSFCQSSASVDAGEVEQLKVHGFGVDNFKLLGLYTHFQVEMWYLYRGRLTPAWRA